MIREIEFCVSCHLKPPYRDDVLQCLDCHRITNRKAVKRYRDRQKNSNLLVENKEKKIKDILSRIEEILQKEF